LAQNVFVAVVVAVVGTGSAVRCGSVPVVAMNADASPNSLYGGEFRLRDYLIRPQLNRIERGETSVTVEPRVMDVLVHLAEHAGRVVSREQLLDELWGDTVVVEHALTRVISELRRLLGDDPETPLFIETIRKRGYRLVAPVVVVAEKPLGSSGDGPAETPVKPAGGTEEEPASKITPPTASGAAVPPGAQPEIPAPAIAPPREEAPRAERSPTEGVSTVPSGSAGRAPRSPRWILWPAVLLAAVAVIWTLGRERIRPSHPAVLESVPLTSYAGSEQMPSLSPDGTRVAFSWDGPDRDNVDVYVKQKGAEVPLRLTSDPGYDVNPSWSPDGAVIAFTRRTTGEVAIWTIPAIGGVERKLYQAAFRIGGIDWSPDGTRIVFSEPDPVAGFSRLRALDIESLEAHDLDIPPPQRSDVDPAFSPDGRSIAFIRQNPAGYKQICLIPASGGEARALTQEMRLLYGFTWRSNGSDILFTSPSTGSADLWQLSVERRSITPLVVRDQWLAGLSCARHGAGLVCETWTCDSDIWEMRIDDRGRAPGSPEILIRSTRWDGYPSISPDGRRIAFASGRSGHSEIWMCERDGSRPVQLTSLNGLSIGSSCRWSADGEQIAYTTSPDGFAAIFVVSVAGGRSRRLSFDRFHEQVCDWSRDGEWIYFASDREDGWQIWKMHPDGSTRTRLTRGGGIEAFESSDAHDLYFVRPEGGGVWRVDVDGGEETKVLETPTRLPRAGWTVHGTEIYSYDQTGHGCFLSRRSLRSGEAVELAPVPGTPGPGIEVSPDGTRVLYSRADDNVADLVLIEGYR